MSAEQYVQRAFMIDEEDDFNLLQKALTQYAKRKRADAENTKRGYGTTRSASKRDAFLHEAQEAENLINRMVEIFI